MIEESTAQVDAATEAAPGPDDYSLGLDDLLSSDQSLAGMEIDRDLEAGFRKSAFELGLSQEHAGSLAQMYARHQARINAETAASQAKAMEETEAAWLRELKADKNFPAQLGRARAAIQAYGSPELVEILENTRLGSHPAIVRFMARVGQGLAEPAFAKGQSPASEKSPAEILYPNQNKL